MKKIMFNEGYGLQKAVLEGRKTMTRRIVPIGTLTKSKAKSQTHGKNEESYIRYYSYYKVGDKVAIAQRYSELSEELIYESDDTLKVKQSAFEIGWRNKMYVNAELMPHHIRITNVKVEHLHDISDEDCLKEGISYRDDLITHNMEDIVAYTYNIHGKEKRFLTPREAFASLIDKTSGKGTWESNPLVYVYEFELVD